MNDSRARIVLSVLLILMGLAFLAFEVAGWAGITLTWPLGIIAVGGLLFLAMLLGGRGLGVLAIPASIVTTLGAIFWVQERFNLYQTWAYAWTLIIVSVGLGMVIYGLWSNLPEMRRSGWKTVQVGIILFLIFGAIFELLFSLVGVGARLGGGLFWSLILAGLGVLLLAIRLSRFILRRGEAGGEWDFFWPLMFITFGMLWLLVSVSALPSQNLTAIFRLWPAFLVVIGLLVLVGYRYPLANLALGLITAAVIVWAVWTGAAARLPVRSGFLFMPSITSQGGVSEVITGNGQMASETRELRGVSSLLVEGASEVTLVQGAKEELVIEADENLLPYLTSRVVAGKLVLGIQPGVGISPTRSIRYRLTVKSLNEIEASGASKIMLDGWEGKDLSLRIEGASEFSLKELRVDRLEVTIDGLGKVTAAGIAPALDVEISGSGTLEAGDLRTERADVRVDGLGNVTLWVTDELETRISGAGSVAYYGSPRVKPRNDGLATLRSLGEK